MYLRRLLVVEYVGTIYSISMCVCEREREQLYKKNNYVEWTADSLPEESLASSELASCQVLKDIFGIMQVKDRLIHHS